MVTQSALNPTNYVFLPFLKAHTPWRLCYFKVCIMWIGHITLTHGNPLGVKSSRRTDALLMLCQTCAFYLVTKQPCCFISIAEPAGNALLNVVGDMTSSGWNVWKHTLSLSFIRAFCLDCVFLVVLKLSADLKQWQWCHFHFCCPKFQLKSASTGFTLRTACDGIFLWTFVPGWEEWKQLFCSKWFPECIIN